jgi:hypothetical protein
MAPGASGNFWTYRTSASRDGPQILEFLAPKTPPLKPFGDKKKSWGKKKSHKHHPKKKARALPFALAR